MANFLKSIVEARNRGASDDVILGEIIKQNPDKSPVFQEAIKRGAQAKQILDKVIDDNGGNEPSPFRQVDVFGNRVRTVETAGGIAGDVIDVGIGFGKGAGETLATPAKSVGRVAEAIGSRKVGAEATKGIQQLSQQVQSMFTQLERLDKNDPGRDILLRSIQDTTKEIGRLGGETVEVEEQMGQQTEEQFGFLEPEGTAQKIGFGAEKLAEFIAPTKLISSANKIANASVEGTKLVSGARKTIATAKEVGEKVPMAARLVTGGAELTKIGLHTIPEAISAYGVSMAQGATHEEAIDNAKWAAAIVGGIGITLKGVSGAGTMFKKAANRLYHSALKPSTAKGMPAGKDLVKTGLDEAIILTEGGVERTAAKIDDLEIQLGKVIEESGKKNGFVKTASLKPFMDEAQSILGETVDVQGSRQARNIIKDMYNNFARKYGKKIPVELAQTLKTNTYQVLKNSYGELANATKEGMKQLTRGLKEGIVAAAPESGAINGRLRALYQFDEALGKATSRAKNLNLLGLGQKILFTGGALAKTLAFISGVFGTAGKSITAIGLNKIGNALKKLSGDEIKELVKSPEGRNLITRLTGQSLEKLSPAEKKIAKSITQFLDNPKIGLSLEDVSKKGSSNLDSLATEARKYKTAEEFVKAKKAQIIKDYGSEIRFAKVSDIATVESKISPETLAKYRAEFNPDKPFPISVGEGYRGQGTHPEKNLPLRAVDRNHRLQILKEKGVEYAPVFEGKGETLRYSDTLSLDEYLIKTKSQLTDLWKKAVGK